MGSHGVRQEQQRKGNSLRRWEFGGGWNNPPFLKKKILIYCSIKEIKEDNRRLVMLIFACFETESSLTLYSPVWLIQSLLLKTMGDSGFFARDLQHNTHTGTQTKMYPTLMCMVC